MILNIQFSWLTDYSTPKSNLVSHIPHSKMSEKAPAQTFWIG